MGRWARRHGAALALLIMLALAYAWLGIHDGLGSLKGDSLIYLGTARHYAPYWPEDAFAAGWAAVTQFPPLYALVLMCSGGAADFRIAHGVTALCLVAGFATFYVWLLRLGIGRGRAACAVGVLAVAPGTVLQSFYLHPEGLYVALVFMALIALSLADTTRRSRWFWAAAAATALAILTRTVGVALVPALAFALLRARPAGWPAMLALALLPGLAWSVLHDPPASYADLLRDRYAGVPPAEMVQAVGASVRASAEGLASNLYQNAHLGWLAWLLGIAGGAALLKRAVAREPDAAYVAAYLAMLAVWPFPQEALRLTWVVVPFLLGYVLWLCQRAALRLPEARAQLRPVLAWMPLAALALAMLPEVLLLAHRASHPLAQARPAYRHLPQWYHPELATAQWYAELHGGTAEALQAFAERVPEGECVVTTLPLVAGFYLGRPVRTPPGDLLDATAFEDALVRTGCRYILLTYATGRGGSETPFYPMERLSGRLRMLDEHDVVLLDGQRRRIAALAVLEPG